MKTKFDFFCLTNGIEALHAKASSVTHEGKRKQMNQMLKYRLKVGAWLQVFDGRESALTFDETQQRSGVTTLRVHNACNYDSK